MKQAIHEIARLQYSVHLLDAVLNEPIFRTSGLAAPLLHEFGIHEKTPVGLLRQLRNRLRKSSKVDGQGLFSHEICSLNAVIVFMIRDLQINRVPISAV